MKLAIIGGGSTYTPELVFGLLKWNESPFKKITLEDIKPERVSITGEYCKALGEAVGSPTEVEWTTDLESALTDADFVVTQIRVGGNEQRAADERLARSMGWIAQETTGAVGCMKAYRTIFKMSHIVKEMQRICPKAFLINFTNPAGIISSAIYRVTGKQNMAGLCNTPIFMEKKLKEIVEKHLPNLMEQKKKELPKGWKDENNRTSIPIPGGGIDYTRFDVPDICREGLFLLWGGLNHLSWVVDVMWDGISIKDEIIDLVTSPGFDATPYFPMNREYVKKTRTIPSPYLRYFTDPELLLEEQKNKRLRGEEVLEIEKNLQRIYREETKAIKGGKYSKDNLPELPDELSRRGGVDYSRLAVKLIRDIYDETSSGVHILNVPGNEYFMGLPFEKFREIPVVVHGGYRNGNGSGTGYGNGNEFKNGDGKKFFTPITPHNRVFNGIPEVMDLVSKVNEYELFAIKAGMCQDPYILKQALETNPLVEGDEKIEAFLKEVMKETAIEN